jgi:hypothetical protein
MSDNATRLRRSMLMTPGNRPDRMRKAAAYGADCLVLDLEDSVPPASKAEARAAVAQALRELQGCGSELCVRINAPATDWGADDLAALPLALLDSVMVPKVESGEALRELDERLRALEREQGLARPVELVVMLETPRGILHALAIADATPRTTALFFGSGDYTAATGAAITPASLLFPRSTVAAAAGAEVLTGGELDGELLRPTVIANPRPDLKVSSEEVFGPVVTVTAVDSLDEAIELANGTRYGLQAGIFTGRLDNALRAAQQLEFGGVTVNEAPTFRADQMPYGGVKDSGNTREGPAYAVRELTEEHLVVLNL